MSKPSTNLFIVLSSDQMAESQVEGLNKLTRELGDALRSQPDMVQAVSYVGPENLPQGTKVAGEIIFAHQLVLEVLPIVTPWILGKIDAIIKSFLHHGKQVKAKVIVNNREVQITPKTTPNELNKAAQQVKAASELSSGRRLALVIGNSNYKDDRLAELKSAVVDAERLADVLSDPNIGAFSFVETLINKTHDVIAHAIEQFFKNKTREDLLLLYFSGHGIKSPNGLLYLSAQNTSGDLLRSTGISSNFIRENMSESNSLRQILILDCCYGGAIVEGAKSDFALGQPVNSVLSFQPSGFGKIIITASEAMQYAYDGSHIEGRTQNSAFTRHLIEGLKNGEADTDNDGLVDIDELYQYVYKHVTPAQTPNISTTAQEGRMYMGLNPNATVYLAQLPDQLQYAMKSESRLHRQGAVTELGRLLKSPEPSMAASAEAALRHMAHDDSKTVADYAQEIINQHFQIPAINATPPAQKPALPKSYTQEVTADTAAQRKKAQTAVPSNFAAPSTASKRNAIAGGFANVLIPGLAHALSGNWTRGVITFAVVVMALIGLATVFLFDFGLCSGPLALLVFGYLFYDGIKEFQRYNERR